MRYVLAHLRTTSAAPHPHAVFVILSGFVVLLSGMGNLLAYGLAHHKLSYLLTNMFGFLVLAIVYLVWVFRVGRGLTPGETGGGFTVVSCALILRATCELLLALGWQDLPEPSAAELPRLAMWVAVARHGGFVALVWGFALVAVGWAGYVRGPRESDPRSDFASRHGGSG